MIPSFSNELAAKAMRKCPDDEFKERIVANELCSDITVCGNPYRPMSEY